MGGRRKSERIGVGVIGCFETGRLLVRSWKNHSRMHCCSAADFDLDPVTLVLGVRRHRGVYRLRNSCSREFLSLGFLGAGGTELQGLDPSVYATSNKTLNRLVLDQPIVGLHRTSSPLEREGEVVQWGPLEAIY